MGKFEVGQYCWSECGELYGDCFNTLVELLREYKEYNTGKDLPNHIGICKGSPGWYIDADDIIETMTERLSEEVGEVAYDHEPDYNIVKKHLDAMLDELEAPNCYSVEELTKEEVQLRLSDELVSKELKSLNKTITDAEFDRKFDAGEDMSEFIDFSTITRFNKKSTLELGAEIIEEYREALDELAKGPKK